jgi:hypothetical protein
MGHPACSNACMHVGRRREGRMACRFSGPCRRWPLGSVLAGPPGSFTNMAGAGPAPSSGPLEHADSGGLSSQLKKMFSPRASITKGMGKAVRGMVAAGRTWRSGWGSCSCSALPSESLC